MGLYNSLLEQYMRRDVRLELLKPCDGQHIAVEVCRGKYWCKVEDESFLDQVTTDLKSYSNFKQSANQQNGMSILEYSYQLVYRLSLQKVLILLHLTTVT